MRTVYGVIVAVLLTMVMSVAAPKTTAKVGLMTRVGACMDMGLFDEDQYDLAVSVDQLEASETFLNRDIVLGASDETIAADSDIVASHLDDVNFWSSIVDWDTTVIKNEGPCA